MGDDNGSSNTGAKLSPQALDALVSGVALYPDDVVEQALSAATDPSAIQQVSQLSPEQYQQSEERIAASIRYLHDHVPQLLAQLNQHIDLTSQLGVAAQTQLSDVWAAVDRARERYSTSLDSNNTSEATTTETNNTYVNNSSNTYAATGAYAAGVLADDAVNELNAGPYVNPYRQPVAVNQTNVAVATGNNTAVVNNGNTNVFARNQTNINNANINNSAYFGKRDAQQWSTRRPQGAESHTSQWASSLNPSQREATSGLMSQTWGQLDQKRSGSQFTKPTSTTRPQSQHDGNSFTGGQTFGRGQLQSGQREGEGAARGDRDRSKPSRSGGSRSFSGGRRGR